LLQQSETYIEIDVNGKKAQCLPDSGCDRSVVPRKLVKTAVLTPTAAELYAANGTKIPVLGSMKLQNKITGLPLVAQLLVSDAVDEFMFGYDWLAENNCEWHFGKGIVVINGVSIKFQNHPTRATVRRVYVREQIVFAAGHAGERPRQNGLY
jgi:hypothetical protein